MLFQIRSNLLKVSLIVVNFEADNSLTVYITIRYRMRFLSTPSSDNL